MCLGCNRSSESHMDSKLFKLTAFQHFVPPPPLQVRWTKTAGSASDKFQETSIYNETLRIEGIQRVQGGRYYCKAENGVGVAAIKSIRVDVQCKWPGRKRKKKKLLPLLNHS